MLQKKKKKKDSECVFQLEKLGAHPQQYESVIKVGKCGTSSKQPKFVDFHILLKISVLLQGLPQSMS